MLTNIFFIFKAQQPLRDLPSSASDTVCGSLSVLQHGSILHAMEPSGCWRFLASLGRLGRCSLHLCKTFVFVDVKHEQSNSNNSTQPLALTPPCRFNLTGK